MGTQISISTVASIAKQPIGPLIGFGCQFVMMPLTAYFLTITFLPSENITDKLIRLAFYACACCPGGGKSTFWTIIFNGNLNMSIAMTITQSLGSLALFGMIFIYFYKDLMAKIKTLLKILSWILTFVITIMVIVIYRDCFHYISWRILFVCCIHPYTGYIFSYFIAWIFKRDHIDRVTIAIETGTQNIGIAVLLLMDTFMDKNDPKIFIALTVPLILSLTVDKPLLVIWMIKTARKKFFKEEKKEINNEKTKTHFEIKTDQPRVEFS
ncbi:hypothetical protein FO519_008592 [Halicephalobus sp. NKZ332]|nr:hypothetical protein FO519_008592 [Halicephalobus sp. NKZ332]